MRRDCFCNRRWGRGDRQYSLKYDAQREDGNEVKIKMEITQSEVHRL